MSKQRLKIFILDGQGEAYMYPNSLVETNVTVAQIIQDIKDAKNLHGEYELYVKIDDVLEKLDALCLSVTGLAVLPAKVDKKPSVELA